MSDEPTLFGIECADAAEPDYGVPAKTACPLGGEHAPGARPFVQHGWHQRETWAAYFCTRCGALFGKRSAAPPKQESER